MGNRTRVALLLVAACGLALWASHHLLTAQSGQTPALVARYTQATNAVRGLNTAEQLYRGKFGRFGSYEELQASGLTAQTRRLVMIAPEGAGASPTETALPAGTIPAGFKLDLKTSFDGTAYWLALRDLHDKRCMTSFFSDERGAIFQGSAISCAGR